MNLRWGLNRVIHNHYLEYIMNIMTGSFQDLSELTVSVSQGLVAITKELCSCDLTTEESTLTYSSSNGRQITFSTAIVYSSQAGDITASSVADSLQLWFIRNQKPVLNTIDATFILNNVILLETNETVPVATSSSSSGTASVAAGSFFGGLLLGVVVVVVGVVTVW